MGEVEDQYAERIGHIKVPIEKLIKQLNSVVQNGGSLDSDRVTRKVGQLKTLTGLLHPDLLSFHARSMKVTGAASEAIEQADSPMLEELKNSAQEIKQELCDLMQLSLDRTQIEEGDELAAELAEFKKNSWL